jgi:hypothetical protein
MVENRVCWEKYSFPVECFHLMLRTCIALESMFRFIKYVLLNS